MTAEYVPCPAPLGCLRAGIFLTPSAPWLRDSPLPPALGSARGQEGLQARAHTSPPPPPALDGVTKKWIDSEEIANGGEIWGK